MTDRTHAPTSKPTDEPLRRGRPRRAELDARLDAAVLELLHGGGPAAVTMERVAATSGVAKTSIYRRHPDRAALLTDVLSRAIGTPEVPYEGTVRDKTRFALQQAWHQMADVLGPGGLAAVVGRTDPEFTEVFRAALQPYERALVLRIEEDSRAGRLRRDLDAEGAVSLMVGAYLGELVRHGRVEADWLDRCMEMLWLVLDGRA